jgi:hypothetical protein
MALKPTDEQHALQIQAGTLGRKTGHDFEDNLTSRLNSLPMPYRIDELSAPENHLFTDKPERSVLHYICSRKEITKLHKIIALSTGTLATSEAGKRWLDVNGVKVSRCKSDIILTLKPTSGTDVTVGISTKQCNNKNPTNAQLYFTTAKGFCNLLRNNGIKISEKGEIALRQFCGDEGFRPLDSPDLLINRQSDPRRFFWEEINSEGRVELENLLTQKQDEITRLLLQKAYLDDPFAPDFILHKTKRAESWDKTEVALYTIDELTNLSRKYAGFALESYSVKKGSYRDPEGVRHLAPRFGIVQMQRGGQSQHPTQLQFNLKAGYFYKI